MLKFEGSAFLRQRLVLATLSNRPILVQAIRANDEPPGLRDFEASLLRLIEKITNGCRIEIDETGTSLYYKPGILMGGTVRHDCGTSRAIGYFLEALVVLAPFCKHSVQATLLGITNHEDNLDVGVDAFRTVTLPNLRNFGISEFVEFKIKKRGAAPSGGGEVFFRCPIVKALTPIELVDRGLIKRIRGICYTTRLNPSIGSRVIDAAKGQLLRYAHDVFIYSDHYKGAESGQSPGYGLTLVAETTSGCFLSAEVMAAPQQLPDELAQQCTDQLLSEILLGGCVDTPNQSIVLSLLALTPDVVSTLRLGKLSDYTITTLRHIRDFFGLTYQLAPDVETKTILVTACGVNLTNLARNAQ